MIWEWVRFGLVAVFLLSGLFTMFVSILGLFRFDFALNRIHAASMADTMSLLLFVVGVMLAVGINAVVWKFLLLFVLQWLTAPMSSHMLSQFEFDVDDNLAFHVDISDAEFHEEDLP